jgi:hypothetical protein
MALSFNRKAILADLQQVFTDVVDTIIFTDRTEISPSQVDKFAVIRLPQGIRTASSIRNETYAQIVLFARNKEYGYEDTKTLDEMEQLALAKFPISTDLLTGLSPRLMNGGNDSLGFHSVIIQFKITIRKY